MSLANDDWQKLSRARNKLIDAFIDDPDVTLIGIGRSEEDTKVSVAYVLRIHVRRRWFMMPVEERTNFPEQVDGFPVRVVSGEYSLDSPNSIAFEVNQEESTMNDNDVINPDNLTRIEGIGQKFAAALNQIDVTQYAQLAQFTAVELSETLLNQVDLKVPAKRIESYNWLGQAKTLALELEKESEGLAEESELESTQDDADNQQDWREHAGFMIFFGYEKANEDNRNWQTRVYHNESGDQIELLGTKPDEWLPWVLNKAQLPTLVSEKVVEEETPTSEEVEVVDEMPGAQLEILDVQVSEMAVTEAGPKKQLLTEVHFQLLGMDVDKLVATEKAPKVSVDVKGFDPQTGAKFKESSELSLQAEVYEYIGHLEMPLPNKDGDYNLHHSVSLEVPFGVIEAHYEGPVLTVNP